LKILNQIGKFYALHWQEKKCLLKAYFLLGIMRFAILTVSFKRLSKSLQHHHNQAPQKPLDEAQFTQAKTIGWAVVTAAGYTPWNSNCLAQALTAQRMLKQQHIPGMFFLGVKKAEQQLEAHAWLQCDSHVLIGKYEYESYAIISIYSWH